MVQWQAQKAKVQLRLAAQRLRLLQEKKLALAKQTRREIADLVTKGRIETARLRVETLIGDDIHVELLELIELYSETLSARFALLDASKEAPEPSLNDAVCAIIYSAPHTELKELHILREMLMQKFGRTFALNVINNEPPCVPPRILAKLALYVPPPELVDMYLEEIARGYSLDWRSDRIKREEDKVEGEDGDRGDGNDTDADGGLTEPAKSAQEEKTKKAAEAPLAVAATPESNKLIDETKKSLGQDKVQNDFDALTARFNALKKR